jgi:NAD(P)-dependent dehydrogenase (short-subunit alcohol dehydrogenase family)
MTSTAKSTVQYQFNGKVAFVTGASNGIGRETALAFARSGAKVVACDVDPKGGESLLMEFKKLNAEGIFLACDVSKAKDVSEAIQKTLDRFQRLDFAFNNAGIEGQPGSTMDCTEENFDRTIAINLKGVWLCMKAQIPQMLKQGGGAIVNCSSIAGLVGFTGVPAYTASKHGVIGLTKTAALEFAKQNIRVNAVCPGVIQTPMIDRFTHGEAQIREQLVKGEPVGRVGTPDEIAQAVLWLCSEASSFVTGDAMVVDGGWVAQ